MNESALSEVQRKAGTPKGTFSSTPQLDEKKKARPRHVKLSDRPLWGTTVTISEPDGAFPILPDPTLEAEDVQYPRPPKQYRVGMERRHSGRPLSLPPSPALSGQLKVPDDNKHDRHHGSHTHGSSGRLLEQVRRWLDNEKEKRSRRETTKTVPQADGSAGDAGTEPELDKLEQILSSHMGFDQLSPVIASKDAPGSYFPQRKRSSASVRKLGRSTKSTGFSSDTEYQEGGAIVPTTDVILDNTRTLSYGDGTTERPSLDVDSMSSNKRALKDPEGWLVFKNDILKLAHTLKLKGWRRVPFDRSAEIEVERLSGALTNAVYVVTPPKNLPPATPTAIGSIPLAPVAKKLPPKLLLRVYGPQVEHLIDREAELQILGRLARKRIGPRLLGTFTNGRFEEYFHARTLTAADLRIPETSKQIAKRMRELHDGIELLEEERGAGPFVWQNWEKWVLRCKEVTEWLDKQVMGHRGPAKKGEKWKKRGLVCGVEWSLFRSIVDGYRVWLYQQFDGRQSVREKLVFAHNDAQYGNLLRLEPRGESPLVLTANEHRQLVVIDFEYAGANCPGLEFANHFTEWCYNYHSPVPYICDTAAYPTPAEQAHFLRAYVSHAPQLPPSASSTPVISPLSPPQRSVSSSSTAPSNPVAAFMLDSRAAPNTANAPSGSTRTYDEEEKAREERLDREVKRLMHETRLWRVANSAQWVAWGIVQAKVDGMEEALAAARQHRSSSALSLASAAEASGPTGIIMPDTVIEPRAIEESEEDREDGEDRGDQEGEEEEEGFDYLAYAQERAFFFWGDVLALGLVDEQELPRWLVEKARRVEY